MRILILTSSNTGSAAHHLPLLINNKDIEIAIVIFSEGQILNKRKHYKNKIIKILKIGLLGAINGVRIRNWFTKDVNKYMASETIEDICKKNNIPFSVTPLINCKSTRALMQEANADLGISLGNGYIGQKQFEIPKYGMINIHHEQLPAYQNAQSIIWQIYNMSSVTGYTVHKIDKHIDTGAIIYKENIPIEFCETLKETVAKSTFNLYDASSRGLVNVILNFQELFQKAQPQGKGTIYTTPSIWQFYRIYKNFKKLQKNYTTKV